MSGRELTGRTALVTGVTRRRGIGAAVARELGRAGARLFVTFFRHYDEQQAWGAYQRAMPGGLDIGSITVRIPGVGEVTRILDAVQRGDPTAADQLLPLVYDELRKLAAVRMANEAAGHTLQPTALVHEAWLRLAGNDANVQFANRAHFFAAAAEAMRRILIDRARRKGSGKRGGNWERIDLDKVDVAAEADDDTLLLVNEALEKLAREDGRGAEMAKLRFFGGLTLEEAAQVMGVTERTANRYWAFARVWLFQEMRQALGRYPERQK